MVERFCAAIHSVIYVYFLKHELSVYDVFVL